ncbi:MAG: hypothetical protein PHT32_07945 [Candidatus Omnitrophica bacterium]|nr:hypothetical protein [Candidatus Omnitrophota bacterium]
MSAILLLLFSAAVFFYSSNQVDPDLWGHLTYGQYIFEHLQIPHFDPFSYTTAGATWINHEWLSEFIFYAIYKYAASAGLIIFKTLIGLLTILPLYLAMRRRTKSVVAAVFILIPMWVIAYGFAVRPQIFTYLLFAWTAFFIDKFEDDGKIRYLYLLPVIFLLWANLHGGFLAGLGIFAVYFIWKAAKREATIRLAVIISFSFLVTLVNPYGIELWAFILRFFYVPRPFISEWKMVKVSECYFMGYVFLALCCLAAIVVAKKKPSFYEIAAMFIAFLVSFAQRRHVVLFAILAGIYLPKYISGFFEFGISFIEKKISRVLIYTALISISIVFIFSAVYYEKTDPLQIEIPAGQYPMNAIYFLRENNITGNIFPWFDWAQLCVRDVPGSKVFFDGRYDNIYGNEFIKDYFDVLLCKKDYWAYLRKFPETDIMILNKDRNFMFIALLQYDKEWVQVYSDAICGIWLNNNKRNAAILEGFRNGSIKRVEKAPPYYFGKE